MKKIFAVESVSTFYEVHLVEAEDEDEAKIIASNSDYNASKWLGQQFSSIYEYSDKDRARYDQFDSYFFDGYAYLNENQGLCYKKMNGEENEDMREVRVR